MREWKRETEERKGGEEQGKGGEGEAPEGGSQIQTHTHWGELARGPRQGRAEEVKTHRWRGEEEQCAKREGERGRARGKQRGRQGGSGG